MPISVEEIKKLSPKAEVYALDHEVTHIITAGVRDVSVQQLEGLLNALRHHGIKAVILRHIGEENPIHIFEVK